MSLRESITRKVATVERIRNTMKANDPEFHILGSILGELQDVLGDLDAVIAELADSDKDYKEPEEWSCSNADSYDDAYEMGDRDGSTKTRHYTLLRVLELLRGKT